jgi:hypothetical protein
MLKQLLKRVARGGIRSISTLAREMDMSEPMLLQMTEDLARLGYLKPVSDGCNQGCTVCPVAGGCSLRGPAGLWTLTEKGRRAAEPD